MKTKKSIKQDHQTSKKKQKYAQKFLQKWLNIFSPWLVRCEDDPNRPFCRACQCRLVNDSCHLQRHGRTMKHARNLEILVSEGEDAVRENLRSQQERSKYYQQRKKCSTSQDASELGVDTADEDGAPEGRTAFHFVQTESAPGDQYTEETVWNQGTIYGDAQGDQLPTSSFFKQENSPAGCKKDGNKNERMQLLMQIQKDKDDLMESFRQLSGVSNNQSPPKEKDHVDLFFESVSSSVKALSPKSISETKMRVSQLICELELRALAKKEANASGSAAGGEAAVILSPDNGGAGNAFNINQSETALVKGTTQNHQRKCGGHYEALS